MSIHPASASEPVMRETDSKPSPRDWSLLQGSRAGSKEGQFSSFWDNAVRGAQKLFGLERAEKEVEPEEERSEKSKREEPKIGNGLNAVAGFGGSRFGMSLSMGREFGIGLPNFGRIEQSSPGPIQTEPSPREKPVTPNDNASDRAKERAPLRGESDSRAEEAKAKEASDELPDEEDEKQAKSAERSRRVATATLSTLSERFLSSDKQQVANDKRPVGIETAQSAVNMRKASPEQVKSAPAPQEGSVATQSKAREVTPKAPSAQAIQPQPNQKESVATATKATKTALAPQAVASEAPVAKSTKPQAAVAPVVNPAETMNRAGESQAETKMPQGPLPTPERRVAPETQRQTAPELARPTEGKPVADLAAKPEAAAKQATGESTLAIDAEKAKLSAALQRSARPAATRPTPTPSQAQAQTQTPVESSPEQSAKLSDTAKAATAESTNRMPEQKPVQTQEHVSRMAENARGRRADGAHPNAENNRSQTAPNANQNATENAASQSRVANPDKLEGFAANLRSVTRPEVSQRGPSSRAQGNSVNAVSQGVGSLNGATNGVGQSTDSQSQRQGFDQAPKQDIAAAVKSAASSVRNEKADTSQSFHVEGPNVTQSRRSQAATRMQQTSYVSKSPQEVKEVVATLTKSIDRLSAIKQDSVSVRVNFEQGGTLSLKVSIENGRVTTAMQTDLPGLEGMLKGSWNELVNEVAQKGLKLNAPQFTQPEGEQRNDNFASKDQREGRAQSSNAENGSDGRRSQSSNTEDDARQRGSSHQDLPEQGEPLVAEEPSVTETNELKTYA